jgi:hypothetical protein
MTTATIGHNGGPDIDGPKQTVRTLWAKALFANPDTPVYVMAIAWAIHWFSKTDGTGAALSNEQLEAMCGISYDTAVKGKRWLRDKGYVELKVGSSAAKTRFRMVVPVAQATQELGSTTATPAGVVPSDPAPSDPSPQRPHGGVPSDPKGRSQRPYIQEDSGNILESEERASARPRQDAGNFWQEALNPQSAGVVFDKGKLTLLNGTRAFWLDRFEADEKRLDLALIQIAPALQPNSQRPLQAQVEGQLAKIVAERLDRDTRYARAATAKAAAAPAKKPFKISRY